MTYFGFVFLTVFSTVASQVLFKLGVRELGESGISLYSIGTLVNLHVFGGLIFSVVSIVSWLVALSKLNLSLAYPFMSITFPPVLICSIYIFDEPVSAMRWLGIFFIMLGLVLIGKFA